MRGALAVLVLVAVIAAGLWWYVLERPGTTESAGDAATATDGTRTAGSGAASSSGAGADAGSGAGTPAAIAESAASGAAAQPDANRTTADTTESEAKKYVETLTDTAPQTIPVDKAEHFVTPERVISLVPEDAIESTSVGALAGDETLSPDTPITVVREVEQIEDLTPEQLIAESGGDLDKLVRVPVPSDGSQGGDGQEGSQPEAAGQSGVERTTVRETLVRAAVPSDGSQGGDGQEGSQPGATGQSGVERITVREALERAAAAPEGVLTVIKTVRYHDVMTLEELLDNEPDADAPLKVVTKPYRLESATLADLLRRQQTESPDSIFYLHTVRPTDEQGIWGIIHFGLIGNFARGMAIRRGGDVETYTIQIPRDADERLDDQSSSFLGRLIDRKTRDSLVYNYRDDRIGRNPDRVHPGQEIVIVRFDPDELMNIYAHFATD